MYARGVDGKFVLGILLTLIGGYLLTTQVTVATSIWRLFGYNGFGVSLILLLLGVGILFFNGRSPWGWILTGLGAVVILLGILLHLNVYFRATSLFSTLVMLILLVAGLGLIARSRLA